VVSFVQAVFLGIVQGLTEWLPISSSGHLVILQQIFSIEVPLLFDVMLHIGTVAAVFVFFRREIWKKFQALLRWDVYAGGRMLSYIAVATVPVAVVGYFFRGGIALLFKSLQDVGVLMVFTGFILFNTRAIRGKRKLGLKDAVYVGFAQAASLAPGISRSGMTISTVLMRGVRKEQAFTFSFMLAIPAIIGASVLELYNAQLNGSLNYVIMPEMWLGTAVAFVVGYVSLQILKDFIIREKFYKFGVYCWVVGFAVLLYTLLLV